MPHFDDLNPDESQELLDAMFPPGSNARAIIDSTPPSELSAIDQALAAAKERRRLYELTATPEQQAEDEAAMEAMAAQDWSAFEVDLQDTERKILRERGIEPPQ